MNITDNLIYPVEIEVKNLKTQVLFRTTLCYFIISELVVKNVHRSRVDSARYPAYFL